MIYLNLVAGMFCLSVGLYEYTGSIKDVANVVIGIANFMIFIKPQ
jgi:hypothetical protein